MVQRFSYDTVCMGTTTDANWTSLEPGFEVPEATVSRLDFKVTASDYGANHVTWQISAVAKRYAGMNPSLVTGGSYVVTKTATGGAAWSTRLMVYNDLIKIDVKGDAGRNIDWIAVGQDPVCLYGIAAPAVSINDLISYWKLDESSDGSAPVTRYDSYGINHLTDNNTVPSTTGLINNSCNFLRTNNEYLSNASNASLQVDSTDFTLSWWIKLVDLANYYALGGKTGVANAGEWDCYIEPTTGAVHFRIFSGGSVQKDLVGASVTSGVWHLVIVDYATSTQSMEIIVDDAVATIGTNSGINPIATNEMFAIGESLGSNFMSGLIDESGFWKRILTANEKTQLYNSGAGLTYPF